MYETFLYSIPARVLADEIGENVNTVASWRRRGIPPRVWPKIVEAASRRGRSDITIEALASSYFDKQSSASCTTFPQKVNNVVNEAAR